MPEKELGKLQSLVQIAFKLKNIRMFKTEHFYKEMYGGRT